jgi:glutamyl-tRNA synthetase
METKNEIMNKQEQENVKLPKEIIEKLFPHELPTPEDLEKKYPPRNLPEGAMVTRVAPSPTGKMHIGGLYAQILAKWFAHQTKGVSFLRIEDTDLEREEPGARELIPNVLEIFGLAPDEGPTGSGEEEGKYGPYTQTKRASLYQSFAKKLVEEGRAYPCFMSKEEVDAQKEEQTEFGFRPGYRRKYPAELEAKKKEYEEKIPKEIEEEIKEVKKEAIKNNSPLTDDKENMLKEELEKKKKKELEKKIKRMEEMNWTKWRDASPEQVEEELKKGTPYTIRLRANGDYYGERVPVNDEIKGTIEFPQNDIDGIVLKSDGLPVYHFAHVVDDHLMRTTDVMRGSDWIDSTPLHLEMFSALGWEPPKYGHFGNILKQDGVNEKGDPLYRKISKRKDPEADAMKYVEWGYPPEAVIQYLLNMMNSDFEDKNWRKNHPNAPLSEFEISFKKLEPHAKGSVFDFKKLDNISRMDVVGHMPSDEIYEKGLEWAKQFNPEFAKCMEDSEYTKAFLALDYHGAPKGGSKKKLTRWDELPEQISYIYDDLFHFDKENTEKLLSAFVDVKENNRPDVRELAPTIISEFLKTYDKNDDRDTWWGKIKSIAFSLGFAESNDIYHKAPEKYKGDLSDATRVFRVLLAGKRDTPDLYSLMKVMGKERILKRLQRAEG